jgi:LysR family glycine cleavage system transcriptional activator
MANSAQRRAVVRLTTDAFVAHEVLIPALHTFPSVKHGIDLRLETSSRSADLYREELDAAVRFGIGPWPGLTGTPLCDVMVTAICAPASSREIASWRRQRSRAIR